LRLRKRFRNLGSKWVKNLAHHSSFTVRRLRKLRANFIITFHLVTPRDSARFEATVQFLADNFRIVRLEELLSSTATKESGLQKGLVALSFDDGLRTHGEVVYPVLKRLRVPATFYVCALLVGHPGSVWTWETYSRLKRLTEAERKRFLGEASRCNTSEEIVHFLKTIPVDRREEIEREIRGYTPNFQFNESEREQYELMNWQQLRSLDPDLVTIGAHTATHVDLPQADLARLERELSLGKEILETTLGRRVEHFAYPNGNFDDQVMLAVQKYYVSAVTSRPGVVKSGDNPFLLQRIHAEFDLARFSWDLAMTASRSLR
jgi:peptidoglycan/xylan/chitin deacetylase (PgdA/CDA1 family)